MIKANRLNTKLLAVFLLIFITFPIADTTLAKTIISSSSYAHWSIYGRASTCSVIRRHYVAGTVGVEHKVLMTSGATVVTGPTPFTFVYSASNAGFTFNGTGLIWDTPFGKWVNNIETYRLGELNANATVKPGFASYWQTFTDPLSSGRRGAIAWNGVKPTGTYMTSSDNSVITCVGMACNSVGAGTAVLTAHIPQTLVRLWSRVTFDSVPPDDISEHWQNPNSVNFITANCIWAFCPTTYNPVGHNDVNMCANKLSLPAKTITWNVTVNPLDGVCGAANNYPYTNPPLPADLCSSGTAVSFVNAGGYWTWTCQGVFGGASPNCQTLKIKDSGLRVADDNNNDGVIQPSEIITLMSEDGTCFSPLRIFKSPNIECMTLVNVGDVNASNIRVNTANGGVKAIMLKP